MKKNKNKKIGILGGSFDPAHEGHVSISKEAKKRFGIDKIIWSNKVKSFPTSIMVKPVTVTAEVAVKNASHKPTSASEHKGLERINVPKQIINNPVITVN